MTAHFQHLGIFSDWVSAADTHSHSHPNATPGAETRSVLALHSHDGYKYFGKEKIADGPDGPISELTPLRDKTYQGRAFANALAARGFVVLVHDVFLWGSRSFPLETMPESIRDRATGLDGIEHYNAV